jgi:ParB family chromosome partitioning protein
MSSYRSRIDQLAPPTITPSAKHQGVRQDVLHHIDLERLRPSPDNPRSIYPEPEITALADSLASLGQQQPISCYWSAAEQAYVIIQGHCRYHAAKHAGLRSLCAVVVPEDLDATTALAKRMAENTGRIDMHPLDCAKAIRTLMDAGGMNQEQVAKKLGRSQAWVSTQLRLLALPADQQAKLAKGELQITEARQSVVKRTRTKRGPKRIRLAVGGLVAVLTFKRVADECSAAEALERLRAAAGALDAKQAKDAA